MNKVVTYYNVFTKKEKQPHSIEEQEKFFKDYISNHKELEFIEIPNKKKTRREKNEESSSLL